MLSGGTRESTIIRDDQGISGAIGFVICRRNATLARMKRMACTAICLVLGFLSSRAGAEPVLVSADPQAGFNFPYVLAVPENIPQEGPLTIVVETNNTGARDDFVETTAATLKDAAARGVGPMLSRYIGLPLVMPVFPRTRKDWQTYTHALDRDTMLAEGSLERLDRQLLAMVADATRRLEAEGHAVRGKFIICGFSASGSFANRFAFLHPERLLCAISGAVNAFPMLPVDELEGDAMNFPLGTADMEAISGRPFQAEAWQALPQMIFMGAVDDNDAVKYDDAYSGEERELIFRHLAEDMSLRWMKAQLLCLEAEPRINFVTYGQVGHWTNRQIGLDMAHFVQEVLRESEQGG